MADLQSIHVPVLLDEVIERLAPKEGQVFVDGTLGGGGHTRALAEAVGASGLVIAVDRDMNAIEAASETMRGLPIKVAQSNFCDVPELLAQLDIEYVDGVLLDIGLSSDQLADRSRGFSFDSDGPLDLRFDASSGEPASRLLNRLTESHLADLIYQLGEERLSRRIARKIVAQRRKQPIQTAAQLAEIVRSCVPRSKSSRIDPATRTFQALRIAVNEELKSLDTALARMASIIRKGGHFAVISFHSLEDRRVKTAFREDDRYESLTKKPITASEQELERNPRSRSAKLRVAQRTAVP